LVERERAVLIAEKFQLESEKRREYENGVRLHEALSGVFDISCRALGKPSDFEQTLSKASTNLIDGFGKIQESLKTGLEQLKPKKRESF
jgi:hypothetical protein